MTMIGKIVGGGLLSGKKTYIAAGLLILNALAGYLGGDIDLATLINQVIEGGGLAFLRSGIAKGLLK